MSIDKSWFFCNEWECQYRKNEKYKEKTLCDMVFDGCPYDEEYSRKKCLDESK